MKRHALWDVVHVGGLALQSEDCAIRAAVAHRGEHGGIYRLENERFHQFVIWRAVLPFWHATVEKDLATDLILDDGTQQHFFEFKNWRRNPVPPTIKNDGGKLQSRANGYIVVTSGNPVFDKPDRTDENIRYFEEKVVDIDLGSRTVFRFDTVNDQNKKIEYWIAGWKVVPR